MQDSPAARESRKKERKEQLARLEVLATSNPNGSAATILQVQYY
jgi:hypothetical protein